MGFIFLWLRMSWFWIRSIFERWECPNRTWSPRVLLGPRFFGGPPWRQKVLRITWNGKKINHFLFALPLPDTWAEKFMLGQACAVLGARTPIGARENLVYAIRSFSQESCRIIWKWDQIHLINGLYSRHFWVGGKYFVVGDWSSKWGGGLLSPMPPPPSNENPGSNCWVLLGWLFISALRKSISNRHLAIAHAQIGQGSILGLAFC